MMIGGVCDGRRGWMSGSMQGTEEVEGGGAQPLELVVDCISRKILEGRLKINLEVNFAMSIPERIFREDDPYSVLNRFRTTTL